MPRTPLSRSLNALGRGSVERRRILRIVSRDRIEHDGRVRDAPRHRPDVIERLGHRQHAVSTHTAVRRLETNHAVGRRGVSNRASGVRADRGVTQTRRRRDARPARRHARPSIRIPRIERHVERRVVAGRRAFGQIQLAKHHRTGASQLRHHRGIDIRNEILADRRAAHRADTLRVTEVLHRNRHAMQRPAVLARCDLALGRARRLPRLLTHDRGVALEARIDPVRFDPACARSGPRVTLHARRCAGRCPQT